MSQTKTIKLTRTTLMAFCVHFLILTYLLGSVPSEIWHDILHSHEHLAEHSQELEKDPCHRSIYHHDAKSGCEHKTHLTSGKKCCLTTTAVSSVSLISDSQTYALVAAGTFHNVANWQLLCDTPSLYRSSRAPPVL